MIDMTAVRELMSRFTPTRSISHGQNTGICHISPADILDVE